MKFKELGIQVNLIKIRAILWVPDHISFGKYLIVINKTLQDHSKQQYAILLYCMKKVPHIFSVIGYDLDSRVLLGNSGSMYKTKETEMAHCSFSGTNNGFSITWIRRDCWVTASGHAAPNFDYVFHNNRLQICACILRRLCAEFPYFNDLVLTHCITFDLTS